MMNPMRSITMMVSILLIELVAISSSSIVFGVFWPCYKGFYRAVLNICLYG